jgi:hypothetical protein
MRAAKLAEAETRTPVETHAHDPFRLLRVLHALQAEELAGRRDEKRSARTADLRLRHRRRNLLAKRRGESQAVEVDP